MGFNSAFKGLKVINLKFLALSAALLRVHLPGWDTVVAG
jgi:hypothetical protein